MKLMLAILALLTLATAGSSAHADALDVLVQSEQKRQFSPAVGVAVVKNGQLIKVRGYGMANLEHRSPASAQTLFQTGSVGKQFTAALVMLLARDGKLSLEDPVSRHLSDAPPSWQAITIRQLLNHSSGLPDADTTIDLRKDYSERELLASAYKVSLQSVPGAKHAYSDLGYQVLGVLCSSVGGRFWGDQLHDRVFKPLGMTARVISERDIVPRRAAGYDRHNGVLENQAWVAPSLNTTADGSLYVSAQDMARWAQALDTERLFTRAEKEALWKPSVVGDGQRVGYGLGWAIFEQAGHRLVRHRGDWQGFAAHILHLPEDRLTVSVLMNRARGQPQAIADRIAAHFIPALRKPALAPPSAAILRKTPMFLRGVMNGWKDTSPLLEVEPGLFQVQLDLRSGMQQFKVGDMDWKVANLGARFDEAVVKPEKEQFLEFNGEDLFFEVGKPGMHTIQLDLRGSQAPRLRVIPPSGS